MLLAPTLLAWAASALERAHIRLFDPGNEGNGFTSWGWFLILLLFSAIVFHVLAIVLFLVQAV